MSACYCRACRQRNPTKQLQAAVITLQSEDMGDNFCPNPLERS
ncbi:hypothetical protein [Acetobacter syzygii]|nr:hypothetical protein [Acetobacter syzygii]